MCACVCVCFGLPFPVVQGTFKSCAFRPLFSMLIIHKQFFYFLWRQLCAARTYPVHSEWLDKILPTAIIAAAAATAAPNCMSIFFIIISSIEIVSQCFCCQYSSNILISKCFWMFWCRYKIQNRSLHAWIPFSITVYQFSSDILLTNAYHRVILLFASCSSNQYSAVLCKQSTIFTIVILKNRIIRATLEFSIFLSYS